MSGIEIERQNILHQLRGGLIVSCQAAPDSPMDCPEILAGFAKCAVLAGAVAIRANHGKNISAIRQAVTIPIIGLKKRDIAHSEVYITPEWQDVVWLRRQAWPEFDAALRHMHSPDEFLAVAPYGPNRSRLAYDELLANQLALTLVRAQMKRASGRELRGTGEIRKRIISKLPYSLTNAQQSAATEILADMASSNRMIRLLQGDVGSGKTVVALLALAAAVESGTQGALMVPTEILARQHFVGLSTLVEGTGLRLAILTGREKGKLREETLTGLASGSVDILIGTHALFQDGVGFHDLGLAVVDEQHRFGVHQRLALQGKSEGKTDLLVMTATPIPRTLALTVYGDMDVSKITEKPAGRLPIDTRVLPNERYDELVSGLHRSLSRGSRAYWVCPLVEESEFVDSAAAEKRFEALAEEFPNQVGLIHGRM